MKKTISFFSLTSCKGCQSQILEDFERLPLLSNFFEIKKIEDFSDSTIIDISLIEGSPDGSEQENFLRRIRRFSKNVVALGACANSGGIQSNRNKLPKKLIDKGSIKNMVMIIKVDYFIPGCPINKEELYRCLMDLYWGRRFTLPDLAVCFECRQNANNCFLKKNKPCLGPITRMGCNSVCLNNGQPCRGCRGIIPQANIEKMMESLHQIVGEEEAENLLSIFGVCR